MNATGLRMKDKFIQLRWYLEELIEGRDKIEQQVVKNMSVTRIKLSNFQSLSPRLVS